MPGWAKLEHITPRRPARTRPGKRGRKTWAITYRDPDLPPNHARVTRSTDKLTQVEALEAAKRENNRLRGLLLDLDRGQAQPKYLTAAHVHGSSARKLVAIAINEGAARLPSNSSARHAQDIGDHFAAYAERAGVLFLDEVSEELLLGWCRTVILEPQLRHRIGEAKWFSSVDLWMRVLKSVLRKQLKWAPQLNSDVLARALPCFTAKKGGQAALLATLIDPTPEQRNWIMARVWGRAPTGGDPDEGGKALSQDTIWRLLHCALRHDCLQLRELLRRERPTGRDIAQTRLVSVDLTQLLLGGFRRFEYTKMKCEHVLLDFAEPMDRRSRTDKVQVEGKRHRWRDVAFTGYTKVGCALVRAQVAGREKSAQYVSEYSYTQLEYVLDRKLPDVVKQLSQVRSNGEPTLSMPNVNIKDLRSTGCNYGQRLLHVQPETRAARWGHTMGVHMGYYLTLSGAALEPCKTLEEAMGCADLMRRALRLLELRNQIGVATRFMRKLRTTRRMSRALEARLADAAE